MPRQGQMEQVRGAHEHRGGEMIGDSAWHKMMGNRVHECGCIWSRVKESWTKVCHQAKHRHRNRKAA